MKTPKNVLFVLTIALLVTACGLNNSEDNRGKRIGTWLLKPKIANWMGTITNTAANTITLDTAYVNKQGRFSIQIMPPEDPRPYYAFRIEITDSLALYKYVYRDLKFISDSSAFTVGEFAGMINYPVEPRVAMLRILMYLNCGHQQDKNEYLALTLGKERADTAIKVTYKIRVDGMYKVASQIVPCRNI